MKKQTNLLLRLAHLLAFVGCFFPLANAQEVVDTGSCGEHLTYTLTDNGVLTVTGTGEMTTAPYYWNEEMLNKVTTIIVEEGVTSLSEGFASVYAINLTSVSLPGTLKTIGEDCFMRCRNLTSLTLPAGVETIGGGLCGEGTKLQSIVLPNTVKTIGSSLCRDCPIIEEIVIPNSVTSLGMNCAVNCYKLKRIVLGTGLTSISAGFCHSCFDLATVEIPSTIHSIEDSFLMYNRAIKSFTLPATITSIGQSFFAGSYIESLTLHNGITDLPTFFCQSCEYLTSFVIPESVHTIWDEVLSGTRRLGAIVVPNAVTSIGRQFVYASGITKLTLGTGVTKISDQMCKSCPNLKEVVIPVEFTKMERCAFQECPSLKEFSIPNACTTIAEYVLSNNDNLERINIGTGLVSLNAEAFGDCPKLREVNVADGNSMYKSSDGIVYNKAGNELVYYPTGRGPVYELPAEVTTIYGSTYPFRTVRGLRSVVFPDHICTFTENVFKSSRNLEEIVMGNSVNDVAMMLNLFEYYINFNNIKQIVLNTVTPPDFFTKYPDIYQSEITGVKLYVPAESVEAYKAIAGWNLFDVKPIPYRITSVGADAHGCCMYAHQYAEAGETVTITPYFVNDLCRPTSVTVTAASGGDIKCTPQADGTYTFVMPAEDVTITSSLVQNYLITIVENMEYGYSNIPDASVPYQVAGGTVEISVAKSANYSINTLTVTTINDTDVPVQSTQNGDVWTFKMPACDVNVEYTLSYTDPVGTQFGYWTRKTSGPITEGDYVIAFDIDLIASGEYNYGYAVVDHYSHIMDWRLRKNGDAEGEHILCDNGLKVRIIPVPEQDGYFYIKLQNDKYVGFNDLNKTHGIGYFMTPKALRIQFDGDGHITVTGDGMVQMATYSKTWGFRPNYFDNEFMQDDRFELFAPKAESAAVITDTSNNLVYVVNDEDNTASFTITYNNSTVSVPETVTDENDVVYTVTAVADDAALYCDDLISVSLPNNVTSIGDQAFAYSSIQTVTFGTNDAGEGEGEGEGEKPKAPAREAAPAVTVSSTAFTGANNINTVNCWHHTPPTGVVFEENVYRTATVNVNAEDLEAYKVAEGWAPFWQEYDLDVTVTVGETGYKTLYYSDRNLTVPAGISAWTFYDYGKELQAEASYTTGKVIPAGTGVVLYTTTPDDYTFESIEGGYKANEFNYLHGTNTTQEVTVEGTPYILLNGSQGVGFYLAADPSDAYSGKKFTNGAHKAYLEIPSGKKAPEYIIFDFDDDDNTTGIKFVTMDELSGGINDDVMYNIMGQPVGNDYKGFVIKNGKKYLNK